MSTHDVLRVSVNGIDVGSVPSGIYDSIVVEVRRMKWLYLAQAFAWISACIGLMGRFMGLVAVMAVVTGIGIVLISPDVTADLWAALARATPQQAAEVLRHLAVAIIVITVVAGVVVLSFSPSGFGVVNVFDREVNRRIRALLEVPVDGTLTVRADNALLRSSHAYASADA